MPLGNFLAVAILFSSFDIIRKGLINTEGLKNQISELLADIEDEWVLKQIIRFIKNLME